MSWAKDGGGPIHVSADRLVADHARGFAEFSGNARASGKNFSVFARVIKVHGKKNAGGGALTLSEKSVDRVTASGNVVIKFDNRVAMSDEAVYITEERRLILTGENASIESEKNRVSGKKIIFDRKNGYITVEGDTGKQVGAVFYPGKETLKQ